MALYELSNVSRYYLVDKKKKYVLKDISLSLPYHGFVTILGKSGSGKSTLLNMLGKIDSPSEGKIYFNNQDFSKYKEKDLSTFHSKAVSFIFQHYHLLNKQTVLYNIMVPLLISGVDEKKAKEEALKLIDDFSIKKELLDKRCSDLSGGERERVAILRAFINNPKVILADEPTGALDKINSILVMEELKKRSKSALVVLVTHNNELAKEYSDRIIYMADGKVVKDERNNTIYNQLDKIVLDKRNRKTNWINKIVTTNFIKRFKRNLFSISALTIGLVSSMLIFGFSNGKDNSIIKSMERQFDYGSASINKENKIVSNDSPITLIQTVRPSREEIEELNYTYTDFHTVYSYDALVSSYPEMYINDSKIEDISYIPIYSFTDKSTNHNLLKKGKMPTFDTLNQVVINQKAYELLNKKLKYDSLGAYIRIQDNHSYSYYTDNAENPYVTDYFVYDRLIQVVGVVNEISFLNTPKIYYSYTAMDKYLSEVVLNNLSAYGEEISWKERIISSGDSDSISSYTCRLFLKDYRDIDKLKELKNTLTDYAITSNALTIEETLFTLVDAASVGMEVFLAIALVGVAMIIGIISFASYNEDIKESAILLCLGAKRDDIALIYVTESLLIGLISVVLSFLLSIVVLNPINALIEHFTSLIHIIDIPFKSFRGHTLLFPFLIIVATLAICAISTYVPVSFSKKISLKEELKAND